jgi:ubiquinone/menaquinone biosynthesis C-methylase UbiE
VHSDAENLPFDDQSFDAVINIEASCLYPRFARFLAEVTRVLRPGGHFLYADYRPRLSIPDWEAALAAAPMRLISQKEINAEVLRSTDPERVDLIRDSTPAFLHSLLLKVDRTYYLAAQRVMQRGEFSYRMYCFVQGLKDLSVIQ